MLCNLNNVHIHEYIYAWNVAAGFTPALLGTRWTPYTNRLIHGSWKYVFSCVSRIFNSSGIRLTYGIRRINGKGNGIAGGWAGERGRVTLGCVYCRRVCTATAGNVSHFCFGGRRTWWTMCVRFIEFGISMGVYNVYILYKTHKWISVCNLQTIMNVIWVY